MADMKDFTVNHAVPFGLSSYNIFVKKAVEMEKKLSHNDRILVN